MIVALLLVAGCSAAPDAVVGAVVMTAVAATSSGISRATGGCYAGCPGGTVCNSITGFCEVLPCRGLCEENEQCDSSGMVEKCVRRKIDVTITTDKPDQEAPEEPQQGE